MSTFTAVYTESDLGRVKLSATGIPAAADTVLFERSLDGVTWTTVRGGAAIPVSGSSASTWDAEFSASKLNTYRATYVDSALPQFQTVGAASTGNNASLTPAAPSGLIDGDLKLILASIRNNGTGVCGPAPTGWTTVYSFQNVAVYGKRHVSGDANPTVTFTGGAAGADTIAQMARFTNSELAFAAANQISNSSAQNVNVPSIVLPSPTGQLLYLGWKQVTLTSTTTPAFATKIADVPSAAGTGASMFWDWFSSPLGNGGVTFPGQSITVTGGSAAISIGVALTFNAAAFVTQQTATVTPVPTQVWLKFPSYPGLNTPITVTDWGDVSRPSRTGVFDIVNRTNPGIVTDVMGSREVTIQIRATTIQGGDDLDSRLAGGVPMFIQAPDSTVDGVFTMYVVVNGSLTRSRPAVHSKKRYLTLPLKEVAAPASTIAGVTFTWQDVVNTYATWADVLAAKAAWLDLLNTVSTASLVVP